MHLCNACRQILLRLLYMRRIRGVRRATGQPGTTGAAFQGRASGSDCSIISQIIGDCLKYRFISGVMQDIVSSGKASDLRIRVVFFVCFIYLSDAFSKTGYRIFFPYRNKVGWYYSDFLGFGWHIPCLWKTRRKSRRHILTNKTVISVLPSLFIIRQEPVIGRSAFELFAICTEHQIIDLIRSTGHLSGIFFPDPGSHYPHQESGLRTGTDQDFFFIG